MVSYLPTIASSRSGIVSILLGVIALTGWTSSAHAATCGKHFLIVSPGTRGAIVDAVVESRHRELDRQGVDHRIESPTNPPIRRCNGPQCERTPGERPLPPVPGSIRISAERIDLAWVEPARDADRDSVVRIGLENGVLYRFEIAPPPTPPPNRV